MPPFVIAKIQNPSFIIIIIIRKEFYQCNDFFDTLDLHEEGTTYEVKVEDNHVLIKSKNGS